MFDFKSSEGHPQPPPNHSTVWIGALRGTALQSTEWPLSFFLHKLLLCPLLLSLLLSLILLQLLHLLMNVSLFLQKLTLRDYSR